MQPIETYFLPNCKHKYQNAKLYHYEQYNLFNQQYSDGKLWASTRTVACLQPKANI